MLNKNALTLFFSFFLLTPTEASTVISGTRIIYPENEKEVTVKINNPGNSPVLIQSWIDDGDPNANPDRVKVPFILKPPLSRIDAGKGQTLRMSYIGGTLARDRETLYWLNVLEVPPINKNNDVKNNLQIAYRTRIKVFFRPDGLSGDVNKAMESLKWRLTDKGLEATNDTPYYVNLLDVRIKHMGKQKAIDVDKVPPFGKAVFSVKGETMSKDDSFYYDYINDWGGINSVSFSL